MNVSVLEPNSSNNPWRKCVCACSKSRKAEMWVFFSNKNLKI